jgi:hypothetical protein
VAREITQIVVRIEIMTEEMITARIVEDLIITVIRMVTEMVTVSIVTDRTARDRMVREIEI